MKPWILILILACSIPKVNAQENELTVNLGGGPTFYPKKYQVYDQAVNYGGHFQYYFIRKGAFKFGIQSGFQVMRSRFVMSNLLWGSQYSGYTQGFVEFTSIPNTSPNPISTYYDQYIPALLLCRMTLPKGFFAEMAFGTNHYFHFNKYDRKLDYFLNLDLGLGVGYNINLNENLSIPLKIRSDFEHSAQFDTYNRLIDGTLSMAAYAGLSYVFK